MGYGVNIDDVSGEEISPGVVKRVLLSPEQNGWGPPGELTVTHYTLTKGGSFTINENPEYLDDDDEVIYAEHQDLVVSGTVKFQIDNLPLWYWTDAPHIKKGYDWPRKSPFLQQGTTVFIPTNRRRTYTHAGESDARLVIHSYSCPKRSHRHNKHRTAKMGLGPSQLFSEEQHALIGAQRIHAIDYQTFDVLYHANPEETCYFMFGKGKMLSGEEWYDVGPGSLIYVQEAEAHEIKSDKNEQLNYVCLEYMEQDKMWRNRGYGDNI